MNIAQWALEDWADGATVLAAGATFLAALIAAFSIVQARRLQDERDRPYVIALTENNEHVPQFLELVIKNVGATVARDIEVSFDPKPQRAPWSTGAELEDVFVPSTIPVLAPGQEWRTMWDSSEDRYKSDLPHRHEVALKYLGLNGLTFRGLKRKQHSETFVLDWEHLYPRMAMDTRTIHHLSRDFHEIRNLLVRSVDIYGFKGTVDVRMLQEDASDS